MDETRAGLYEVMVASNEHRPAPDPAPGIELIERLDAGAMGEVWRAKHRRLDVDVAVKLIHAERDNPKIRRRFLLEARATARLKSPHVVDVLDFGVSDEGDAYIVMELLEGESLSQALDREGPLSAPRALTILRQLAEALDEAHAADILHRDVKPANIWLVPDADGDFVKLLDFGIARASALLGANEKITDLGTPLGTPYYMSPEGLTDPDRIDHRCDLWALAVCAYELLTGDLPYDDLTIPGVIGAVIDGRLRPVPDELGDDVRAFFDRALAADPNRRFQSARELTGALALALADEGRSSGVQVRRPREGPRPTVAWNDLQAGSSRTLIATPVTSPTVAAADQEDNAESVAARVTRPDPDPPTTSAWSRVGLVAAGATLTASAILLAMSWAQQGAAHAASLPIAIWSRIEVAPPSTPPTEPPLDGAATAREPEEGVARERRVAGGAGADAPPASPPVAPGPKPLGNATAASAKNDDGEGREGRKDGAADAPAPEPTPKPRPDYGF